MKHLGYNKTYPETLVQEYQRSSCAIIRPVCVLITSPLPILVFFIKDKQIDNIQTVENKSPKLQNTEKKERKKQKSKSSKQIRHIPKQK